MNNFNSSIESNKKVLLVIDWSNIMFRCLFMHQLFNRSITGDYNRIEDLQSFTNKFAVDVCSIINMFKPNCVVLATDSQHSWRKDVDADYKKGREKDPNVNWDNIYKCSDDLQAIFKKNGVNVAKVEHGEADDIIAMTKELVVEKYKDYNVIIVSADADVRQLMYFNDDTKQYCVVYNTTGRGKNSKRRMYVTQSFSNWLNEQETCDIFFNGYDASKHYMKDLLQTNTIIEPFVDDPDDILLNKILCGDDGDNVKAFYGFYKNGRWVRITPTKAKKILEMTNSNSVKKLCESVGQFQEVFNAVCKRTVDDCDFEKTLHQQRVMVELNSELFPKEIKEYKDTIDYMIRNSKSMTFQNIKAQDILKGTVYESAPQKKSLTANVFTDLDKLANAKRKGMSVESPTKTTADINNILNTLF